jgi:hypothetical protein
VEGRSRWEGPHVIERYFALSTSSTPLAVTDCFAKADKTATFADGAAL